MQNEDFYHRIKARLSDIEPAYDPGDWAAMEALLDKKKRILPLWTVRIAAALAILAIGITGYFYLSKPAIKMEPVARVEMKESKVTSERGKIHSAITTPSEKEDHSVKFQNRPAASGRDIQPAVKKENRVLNTSNQANLLTRKERIINSSPTDTDPKVLAHLPEQDHQINSKSSSSILGVAPIQEEKMEALQRKNWTVAEQGTEKLQATAFLTTPMAEPGTHKKRWYFGLSSRPAIQILESSRFGLSNGINGGVEINDHLAFEGGIFKESMAYRARPSENFYINEEHSESQARFNGLSIPIRGSYRIGKGRIAPYISAGITAFIPYSGYYVFSFIDKNSSASNFSSALQNDTVRLAANGMLESAATVMNVDATNSSFFDQGKRKNLYLLASGGIGVQYQLNSRLGFRVGANYYQPLDGLGVEKRKVKKADLEMSMHYFIN